MRFQSQFRCSFFLFEYLYNRQKEMDMLRTKTIRGGGIVLVSNSIVSIRIPRNLITFVDLPRTAQTHGQN